MTSSTADPRTIDKSRCLILTICFFLCFIFSPDSRYLQAQSASGSKSDSTWNLQTGLSAWRYKDKLSVQAGVLGFDLHQMELTYPVASYQSFLNRSLADLTVNPFTIDTRESSYYVPVRVRDELNLIMNRPRDSAFLPVLGVAWIAYQLGSKYLEIRRKNTIDHEELLNARPALPLLYSLWRNYPQTPAQLYHHQEIQSIMTFSQLLEDLALLQRNNLIKSRFYSVDSIQYFPGLFRAGMLSIIDAADGNPVIPESDRNTLQSIRKSIPSGN